MSFDPAAKGRVMNRNPTKGVPLQALSMHLLFKCNKYSLSPHRGHRFTPLGWGRTIHRAVQQVNQVHHEFPKLFAQKKLSVRGRLERHKMRNRMGESYFILVAEVPKSNNVIMNYPEAILHWASQKHCSRKNCLPIS